MSINNITAPANIWGTRKEETYFRKIFTLDKPVKKAILRIFVDTGYELYLNGHTVAILDEWHNTRDYEITPFLVSGQNIIAIKGINHGGHRGLALELRMFLDDEQISTVVSNVDWKCFSEERWGWKSLDYDDARWAKALVLDLSQVGAGQWNDHPGDNPSKIIPIQTGSSFFQGDIPKYINSPFFQRKKDKIKTPPEIFKIIGNEYQDNLDAFPPDIIMPSEVVEANPGNGSLENIEGILLQDSCGMKVVAKQFSGGPTIVVDFGGEAAGYLRLRFNSDKMVSFRLVFGEILDDCYHLPPMKSLLRKMVTEEVCLCSGVQEWESSIRQGFRFVKIEFMDCLAPVEVAGISIKSSLYPVQYLGYFACSDSLLNQIWSAGRRTLHLCMQEYYLDGIKRDRFLWTGDARLEALINYYAFGDQKLFCFCWEALAEVQYPDGSIPAMPEAGAAMLWDYVAWWIIAFGDYYLHTGKLGFPRSMEANIVRAIDWMISKSGNDGLIVVPKNQIKGWMYILNKKSGKDLMLNSLFFRSLQTASKLMNDLGKTTLAQHYSALADKTRIAFNNLENSLGIEAFTPDFNHSASASLEGFELIESYFKNNHSEKGINFIREYWGGAIKAGSDTLWEAPVKTPNIKVNEHGKEFSPVSRCHGWTAGPTYTLLSEVAGIKPTSPGFKDFEIRPQWGKLTWIKGVVPTPRGLIAVSFERDINHYRGTILIPKESSALICLPANVGTVTFLYDGQKCNEKLKNRTIYGKDYLCIALKTPGQYSFTQKINKSTQLTKFL